MKRGRSCSLEVVIDTITSSASWPWNLSTVPTRAPSGRHALEQVHLHVVGRDDEDVARRHGVLDPVAIDVALAQRAGVDRADQLRLGLAALRSSRVCSTGACTMPVGRSSGCASAPSTSACRALCGSGFEPAVVHRLRDEAAHIGVHAPAGARGRCRARARSSPRRRAGSRAPSRPSGRGARPAPAARAASGRRAAPGCAPTCRPRRGWRARPARPRRRTGSRAAGPRHRRRTAQAVPATSCASQPQTSPLLVTFCTSPGPPYSVSGRPAVAFFTARIGSRRATTSFITAASRWSIALWLFDVMPTLRPRASRCAIMREPV